METRTGLQPMADRNWVQCGKPEFCEVMADKVSDELKAGFNIRTTLEHQADRAWLQKELIKFSGPPSMELRTFHMSEFKSDLDYYGILLRIPLPNSYNPTEVFPVGRVGYSEAAFLRDPKRLKTEVRNLLRALALHEVDEWLRFEGEHVHHPHPVVDDEFSPA